MRRVLGDERLQERLGGATLLHQVSPRPFPCFPRTSAAVHARVHVLSDRGGTTEQL